MRASTSLTLCRRINGPLAVGLAILAGAMTARAQSPERSAWDGVYSAEQAERGAAAYAGECARCHGTDLTGGESAPPLAGLEFMSNWNGLTVGDLFERIRISMPPDGPGRLSRENNADIITLILRFNRFPAGSEDMPNRSEVLRQITLQTYQQDK